MLIRSQNKAAIVNFDNVFNISTIRNINGAAAIYIVSQGSRCNMAEYSTKAKAIKVLDMIQEAYAEYKIICTFFTGFTGHQIIAESNDIRFNGFEELVKSFKKNMVFYMPEDSEVEV